MTRPIPLFRFVFAAYYATGGQREHEGGADRWISDKNSKPKLPALALVVDNGPDWPKKPLWPFERGWELKID